MQAGRAEWCTPVGGRRAELVAVAAGLSTRAVATRSAASPGSGVADLVGVATEVKLPASRAAADLLRRATERRCWPVRIVLNEAVPATGAAAHRIPAATPAAAARANALAAALPITPAAATFLSACRRLIPVKPSNEGAEGPPAGCLEEPAPVADRDQGSAQCIEAVSVHTALPPRPLRGSKTP